MKATRNFAIADPAPTGKHGIDKYKLRPASPLPKRNTGADGGERV